MCRPNSSELQKNINSASTWNFTHMIRCVESSDKRLRENNNVTVNKTKSMSKSLSYSVDSSHYS